MAIAESADRPRERVDLAVGESARRLVEQQQPRRAPSARASSMRFNVPYGRPVAGCDTHDGSGRARPGSPSRHTELPILTLGPDAKRHGDPVRLRSRHGADHDVLDDAHGRKQREVLERARHASPRDTRRRDVEEVVALEADDAPRGVVDPADDVEERRLARSVRSDEATDPPGSIAKGDRRGRQSPRSGRRPLPPPARPRLVPPNKPT